MLLEPRVNPCRATAVSLGFSTLFRVDAIGAFRHFTTNVLLVHRFSTLFRVDAIGALSALVSALFFLLYVSVPSFGSMLLEPVEQAGRERHQEQFQYPLSGRCYWSLPPTAHGRRHILGFSTLFRVDAIGAAPTGVG